jgi:dihydrodipicolinate synthase/N-acetylneuraminate lyase
MKNPIEDYPSATVACFDPTCGELPRRQLDESRTVTFLERLAKAGAPGLLIAASTGHGHLRTVEELQVWFRCAAHAEVGDAVRMALLRPEDGLENNRQLIALLAELAYPIVFFRPGTDLSPDARVDDHVAHLAPYIKLAGEAELAIGVYSIPDVSGAPLPAEAVARLLDQPGGERIVACKITEADYDSSTRAYLDHPRLRELKIVQGWDPHLAQALQDGKIPGEKSRQRCGVTSGPMSFCIQQYIHLLSAADADDWEEVSSAQNAVTQLFQSMQEDPTKFADLQRAKYIMGLGHPLTGKVEPHQVERILTALATVPRAEDRIRLARSLDLMQDGPYHERLLELATG